MGGCHLHSKLDCPAWFQTTLVVYPPSLESLVCMWCRVIPTFEGFQTSSSPLQLVNIWLRHVISGVADQWPALRQPCCNWLVSSVTFKIIYYDILLVSLVSVYFKTKHSLRFIGYHMQHLSHSWYCSLRARPCQNLDFEHEPGLQCNQIGKYHQVKVWIPAAPLSFILFFRLRQQMLLSSGFIVHGWPVWELTQKHGGGDELLVCFSSLSSTVFSVLCLYIIGSYVDAC